MDKNLYVMMQEILEEKKSDSAKSSDVSYLGTITSDEISSTRKCPYY